MYKLITNAIFMVSLSAQAQISVNSSRGSGCPDGTVVHQVSEDGEAVTFIYSDFFVEVDQVNQKDRTNCQLNLTIKVPENQTLGVFGVDHRGFISIEPDVTARLRSELRFKKADKEIEIINQRVRGPVEKDFIVSNQLNLQNAKVARCLSGRSLNVTLATNLVLRTSAGEPGFVTIDSTDGSLEQELGLSFLPCNTNVYAAQCSVTAKLARKKNPSKSKTRQMTVYAKSEVRKKALRRARNKAQRRCQKIERKFPKRLQSCNYSCSKPQLIQ